MPHQLMLAIMSNAPDDLIMVLMLLMRRSVRARDSSTTKAIVVLRGANHCQWSTPTHGGVCSAPECHAM
eukprot:4251172-Prymnesium_polylepis.1